MSELYDMMLWVAYTIARLMMLTVIVAAVLAGLALRFVAESLRGVGDGRNGSDARNGREKLASRLFFPEVLRIKAYPRESGYVPSSEELVVEKRWSRLVLDWR